MEISYLDIVDEENNVIGQTEFFEAHKKMLPHRASFVFLFNDEGKIVLQQRSASVRFPHLLCASAAGHVDAGETYEKTAYKELKEELGVQTSLKRIASFRTNPEKHQENEFLELFIGGHNGPFNINQEEVRQVLWLLPKEVDEIMTRFPFMATPTLAEAWKTYCQKMR